MTNLNSTNFYLYYAERKGTKYKSEKESFKPENVQKGLSQLPYFRFQKDIKNILRKHQAKDLFPDMNCSAFEGCGSEGNISDSKVYQIGKRAILRYFFLVEDSVLENEGRSVLHAQVSLGRFEKQSKIYARLCKQLQSLEGFLSKDEDPI